MEQKTYTSITRLGHRSTIGVLNKGDYIVATEKIDGANSSFRREGDVIRAFSRNQELDEHNTLGGFYQFAQSLNVQDLLDGVIYFEEWTNKHKVHYPNYEKQFFLFDIYNNFTKEYVSFSMVKDESKRLGLNLVPVFYEGEYIDFEHLQSFIGKTSLGGRLGDIETGEGIVVKNYSYKDRFGKQLFVKLVTEAFAEVQKQKKPKDPNIEITQEQNFVNTYLTVARVEKMIYKLVDEGILNEHWGIEDMGIILRNLGDRVYEDMMKEEGDSLTQEFEEKHIRKAIGRILPQQVKNIINKN